MFIKAHCPVCGTDVYHNIRLHALEHLSFEGEREVCRGLIERIQLELDMYCPDRKKLYFVGPDEPGEKESSC